MGNPFFAQIRKLVICGYKIRFVWYIIIYFLKTNQLNKKNLFLDTFYVYLTIPTSIILKIINLPTKKKKIIKKLLKIITKSSNK